MPALKPTASGMLLYIRFFGQYQLRRYYRLKNRAEVNRENLAFKSDCWSFDVERPDRFWFACPA